jgi:hypothetical protein
MKNHSFFLKTIGILSLQLKYHELYHNGECYFLAPNGFQFTRYWMNELNGSELTNGIFHFCQCLQELHLSETEFALVLPLHMCYDGKRKNLFLFYFLLHRILIGRFHNGRSGVYSNASLMLSLCTLHRIKSKSRRK